MASVFELAREHVKRSRLIVARQKLRVAVLKSQNLNTQHAAKLLDQFEKSQANFEARLKALQADSPRP